METSSSLPKPKGPTTIKLSTFTDALYYPFERLGEGIPIYKSLCFNIPHHKFEKGSQTWCGLKCDKVRTMISLLIDCVNIGYDTVLKENLSNSTEITFFKQGIPRCCLTFEELRPVTGGEPPSWRLWLLQFDPKINFDKIIQDNINKESWKHKPTDIGRKTKDRKEFADWVDARLKINNIPDLINQVYFELASEQDDRELIKQYKGQQGFYDISEEDSPFSVYQLFSPAKTITDNRFTTIDPEQRQPSNYFDTPNGFSGNSFKWFPFRDRTYRLDNNHTTLWYFSVAGLPDFFRNFTVTKLVDKQTCDDKIDMFQIQLNQAMSERSETETLYVNKKITSEYYERVSKAQTEAIERIQRELNEQYSLRERVEADLNRIVSLVSQNKTFYYNETFLESLRIQYNDIWKLRKDNLRKRNDIKNLHKDVTSLSYKKAMLEFYETSLNEAWNVLSTSDKLTIPTKKCMAYINSLKAEEQWVTVHQLLDDMSPYASMFLLDWMNLEKGRDARTNHSLAQLMWECSLSAGMPRDVSSKSGNDIKPNVLLDGKSGSGKSWLLLLMESLCFPGSVENAGHITEKAYTGTQIKDDLIIHVHELPKSMLGLDEKGKSNGGNPIMKTIMTEGALTTQSLGFDEKTKKRVTMETTSLIDVTFFGNSNLTPPDKNSAEMLRWANPSTPMEKRSDKSEFSEITKKKDPDDDFYKEIHTRRMRLAHAYSFIVMKLIQAGVFPEVNTEVATEIMALVFQELSKKGIKMPDYRKQSMFKKNVVSAVIYYAVTMEFFSVLGGHHKFEVVNAEKGERRAKPVGPMDFMGIMKWLVCTEEQAIHQLTLHEPILSPANRNLALFVLKKAAHADNININTNFRVTETMCIKEDGEKKYVPKEVDYRYVDVKMGSFKYLDKFLATIVGEVENLIEIRHLEIEINSLQKEYHRVHPIDLKIIDKTQDGKVKYKFIKRPNSEAQALPCVIVDLDPINWNKLRISVLIDILPNSISSVMKETIEKVMSHKWDVDRKYITGYPYSEADERFSYKKLTIHKFPAVLELKQVNKEIRIENSSKIEEWEKRTYFESVTTIDAEGKHLIKNRELTDFDKADELIVNCPIELPHQFGFILENALDYSPKEDPENPSWKVVLRDNLLDAVKAKREEYIKSGAPSVQMLSDYPRSCAESLKRNIEMKRSQNKKNRITANYFDLVKRNGIDIQSMGSKAGGEKQDANSLSYKNKTASFLNSFMQQSMQKVINGQAESGIMAQDREERIRKQAEEEEERKKQSKEEEDEQEQPLKDKRLDKGMEPSEKILKDGLEEGPSDNLSQSKIESEEPDTVYDNDDSTKIKEIDDTKIETQETRV
jgi:hypothetical protein